MVPPTEVLQPRVKKEPIRRGLRYLFPRLYETLAVLTVRRRDRRYYRQQKDLFHQLVRYTDKPADIELETVNRCNSTCEFCPVNKHVDPRILQRMSDELFRRIIDQLADWSYDRVLKLYSNNEPFLDKRIFEFTEYARSKLPNAFLKITTNGTALDVEKLERILPLLSKLVINDYNTEFKLHTNIKNIVDYVNNSRPDFAPKIAVVARRLTEFKTTRAGTAPNRRVAKILYKSRCAYPFFQMVIRPDGKVSLCCNDALGQITLGDVSHDSIREVWNSEARRSIQEKMLGGRDQIPLCAVCDNLGWASPKRITRTLLTNGRFTHSRHSGTA